jgi:hypothetical protein
LDNFFFILFGKTLMDNQSMTRKTRINQNGRPKQPPLQNKPCMHPRVPLKRVLYAVNLVLIAAIDAIAAIATAIIVAAAVTSAVIIIVFIIVSLPPSSSLPSPPPSPSR